MSLIPRPVARRIRPALVLNAALATSLLAVTVAGDSAVDAADAVLGGADQPAQGALDAADVAPPAGRATSGTGPNAMAPGDPDTVLAESLAPLLRDERVRISVTVLAEDTGLTAAFGNGRFDTASIVKVDILAALLLRAQDEGRELTAAERAQAAVMIQHSDNDAADELWRSIGGRQGLDAANERLGLVETDGGTLGHWGLTQTTSADQLALLRAVYGTDSPLTAESRGYLRELMGAVTPEQRWGISAAADGDFELKNGWLPRSRTDLWDVNSIGRITVEGRSYLVAVVSDGHAGFEEGVRLVEDAARAAVAAVTTDQEANWSASRTLGPIA
ncbi:serine hydrolase [Streptomyces millisiae]|uniref:Serine hydrolase n=1 Tax=Streptomyces millisiae TaxID=3075542 RepID=A0ABU2LRH1_9ACTN|nr:serine hydrolase [Streptomyces sp. DSM 44918]MDT0319812.1 serine hydrolase [Streptomyces sp. DSM 44918]